MSSSGASSKVIFENELDNPRIGGGGRDHSKRRARVPVIEWQTKIGRIGEIEKLGSELQSAALSQGKVSLHAEIKVALVRPSQDTHAAISKSSAVPDDWRVGEGSKIKVSIEPA